MQTGHAISVKNASGIYQIRHITSGRTYIGSSKHLHRRWNEHRLCLESGRHPNRHLQRAWRLYGANTFVFEVVEIVPKQEDLITREQWHLDQRFAVKGSHEFNIAPRANSTWGVKLSEETRRRISITHKGRKQTPEEIAKRTAAIRAAGITPRRRAWFDSRKGIKIGPHSPERRQKISETKSGKSWSPALRKAWEYRRQHPTPAMLAVAEHLREMDPTPAQLAYWERLRTQPLSPAQIAANTARRGRKMHEATKAKIGAALKGRILSPEHKEKIAAAHRGKPAHPNSNAALRKYWAEHKGDPPAASKAYWDSIRGTITPAIAAANDACRGKPWNEKRRKAQENVTTHANSLDALARGRAKDSPGRAAARKRGNDRKKELAKAGLLQLTEAQIAANTARRGTKQTEEHRQKVAQAMRESWARRKAEKEAARQAPPLPAPTLPPLALPTPPSQAALFD